MTTKIYPDWTKETWFGNPSLNLQCSVKTFKNPFNGRGTKVWIFGGTKEYPTFSFCVNAGANSDYSYTGFCVDSNTLEEAQTYVDNHHEAKQLFR